MLAIPVMRSEGQIDATSLERVLRNQHHFPDDAIITDTNRFDALRKEITTIHDPNDNTQALLLQYFYQLKSLLPRLQVFESEINFTFHWHDAFVSGRKCQLPYFLFEIAAIVWNLGAFDSIRGAKVDRTTDDGIRLAGKYFQQAAGYFDYLKEHLLPNLPQSCTLQCLSNDCLTMVKNLMLAQGQLCFYEKAVRDKKRDAMKTAIVAKLAAQTSVFYSQTSIACRSGTLGSILDISWFAITDFQAKCFHGAGEYWQAIASKELALAKGSGYGEEITRYNRAEAYVRQAIESGRKHNILPALPAGAEALLNIIISNRANSQKDLTTIYMEAVPNEGSVPEVIGVAMVKPSLLPEQNTVISSTDALLFKFILPRPIVDAMNRFYTEINQIVSRTLANSENATNFGRTTLSSVGLPAALEGIKSDNAIPAALWNKILKIQSMGGVERLKTLVMDLTNSSKRAVSSMKILEEALTSEESKDNSFFHQFPPYNGTRSSVLMADIKQNLQLLRDAFHNAQLNDETITRDLIENTTEQKLLLLSKSREELLKLFPTQQSLEIKKPSPTVVHTEVNLLDFDEFLPSTQALPSPPPPPSGATKEQIALGPDGVALEGKLHELAELFEIRIKQTEKLKSFQTLNIQDAIQQTFINSSSSSVNNGVSGAIQELLDRHLQELNQTKASIEQGIQQQEAIIQDILRLNDSFNQFKNSNPLIAEKNRFLQSIDENITKFFSLHSQVTSGQTFYNNLQAKLTTLQQNADDLAYTQQWQRQEFEKDQLNEHQRLQQEQRDHELAMKLANELNITNNPPPPPASQGPPPTAAAQPYPSSATSYNNNNNNQPGYGGVAAGMGSYNQPATAYPTPNPSPAAGTYAVPAPTNNSTTNKGGIVYGTPVAGPPAGYQHLTQQNPPPPPVAAPVPTATAYNSYQQHPQNPAPPAGSANYSQPNSAYGNSNGAISYANSSGTSSYPSNNTPTFPQGVQSNAPQQAQPYINVAGYPAPANNYYSSQTAQQYPPQGNQPYGTQGTQQYPPQGTAQQQFVPPGTQQHQQPPQQQYQAPGSQTYAGPGTQQHQQTPQQQYHQPGSQQQQYPPQGPPQYGAATTSPSGYNQHPAPPPAVQRNLTAAEMDAKIARVMEMGFPRDQVNSALSSTGWNEEAAINVLLGVGNPPPHQGPPAANAAPAPRNNSSVGGFFWGKK